MIGIIGILAAVAIPAYQSYTTQAKEGVSASALEIAVRNVHLKQSQGASITEMELKAVVKSKGLCF